MFSLVLEVLRTRSDYARRGLAAKLIAWGCEAADAAGQETYLDGAVFVIKLYERFGFVHMASAADPKATFAVPMLRPAKTSSA